MAYCSSIGGNKY